MKRIYKAKARTYYSKVVLLKTWETVMKLWRFWTPSQMPHTIATRMREIVA